MCLYDVLEMAIENDFEEGATLVRTADFTVIRNRDGVRVQAKPYIENLKDICDILIESDFTNIKGLEMSEDGLSFVIKVK